jgi:hypothetical protein
MTQKELHNWRLAHEANNKMLHHHTRRHFIKESAMGLGALALGSLLGCGKSGSSNPLATDNFFDPANPLAPRPPMFPGKAKAVIFIHMAGAPSQFELFSYKPELAKLDGQDCPQSLLEGKRFAFIRGVPKMLGPQVGFKQYGESGLWLSDNLPHLSTVADEMAMLHAVTTDQFNHAPAQMLMHSGSARLGRPSLGSWVKKIKTCLALWCLLRAATTRMQVKVYGATAFCRVCTRGYNAAARATRYYFLKILMA